MNTTMMKKGISLLIMALIGVSVWGQDTNKIEKTGNIGIGTLNPGTKLDVNGVIRTYNIDNNTATWDNLSLWSDGSKSYIQANNDESGLWIKSKGGNRIILDSNVGIGTSEPISKLNVWTYKNTLNWNTTIANEYHSQTERPGVGLKFKLGYKTETSKWAGIAAISASDWENCIDLAFYTKHSGAPSERVRIRYDGNVGIGTTKPTSKLDVNGILKADKVSLFKWYNPSYGHSHTSIAMNGVRENNQWKLYGDGARSSIGVITTDIFGNMRFISHHDDQFTSGKTMTDDEFINDNTKMVIKNNGNIGIGTTTPDYKLDVCGTIRAKEVKVEEFTCSNASFNGTLAANQITVTTNGQTADFVFEEDYELRDLQEVETFIKTNKHLPEIPSAASMEADGVNLAEMNKLLLLKIEELTLYAIDKENRILELEAEGAKQKAEVETQKEKVKSQNEKVESLEERLAKIESLLLAK